MQQSWTHFGIPGTEGDTALGQGFAAEPAMAGATDAALWFTYLLRRKAYHAR